VSEVRIATEPRTEFGKGAARRLRRNSQVPAVLYGHGTDPVHVALPLVEVSRALKTSGVLFELDLPSGKKQLALPKSVQRDPIKLTVEHMDLIVVERGEVVTVDVPVVATGKVAPGGLLETVANTVSVNADATAIPSQIEAAVEGLELGATVTAGDLALPAGVTLHADADTTIFHVTSAQMAAETPAAEAEGAEAAAPAE
jgi:large subunit ribosomal protein L25